MELDVTDLSRLQFAVVTIYHYFFVPLSISLASITAVMQTVWLRTGKEQYKALTLFLGKVLLVTFAVGVVTGLVQEFQFGLAWSDFARFYGDVFGPTLAMEGMLAFFLEATFLGLWYFGWNRMPAKVHLATIWVVAIGTILSAFIILAANSFMQSPVAYTVNEETGRAELSNFFDLMTNEVNLAAFPHTAAGAAMAGGALVLAFGMWRAWGKKQVTDVAERAAWRTLARVGAWVTLAGGAAVALTGDILGKVITKVQPMKMAAAEGLYETQTGAPFSIFALSTHVDEEPFFSLDIPYMLSILAVGDPNAPVQGLNDLQAQYTELYGPGDYMPLIPMAYWTFRLMIGVGMLAALLAVIILWFTRKGGHLDRSNWMHRILMVTVPVLPVLPLAANSFGWIFSETARQPWLVFGLFKTEDGVSPGLTAPEVLLSIGGFTVVYGILAVIWIRLVLHLGRQPLSLELGGVRGADDDSDSAADSGTAVGTDTDAGVPDSRRQSAPSF
ncbi:cytochrome ubiquinol oxidase subunit I [Salinibacterium sp. ZJ450]|uniref:cytochrome ubiquinol oxidase subunit I n=1 Tax=Salinibacterium sp. ZJ450 TaxID=2708338 RepID=UPI001CD1C3F2|nr:cytochrome ubiquinol oxidase subunit I [Salinibacterium sp. ZJ450]